MSKKIPGGSNANHGMLPLSDDVSFGYYLEFKYSFNMFSFFVYDTDAQPGCRILRWIGG